MDLTMLKKNVKKNFYTPFRNKFTELKRKQEFKKNLRKTDVFLVGHPKSGNTWLSRMIASLLEVKFHKQVNLANINEFIPSFHSKDDKISLYSEYPDPRVFRNETPLFPELFPKTIYLIRDPRAVYVSYYHHCIHDTQNHDWSIEAFVDEMLAYGCIKALEPDLIRWDQQVLQWLERSDKQSVKFLKYEDMHKDRNKILTEVADYIGVEYDEKILSKALDNGTFKNMRTEEVTYGAAPYSGDKGEKGFFVRKGKIDSWKEELSIDLARRIEFEFSEVMKKIGYS